MKPIKGLGQHWLKDKATLQKIVDCANLNTQDHVLEVGPGYGTLTQLLLDKGVRVTAVEIDTRLAKNLRTVVKYSNNLLEVINTDILKLNLSHLPKNYKVVANIPYYLTSNLLRVFSEAANPPLLAVLLVQKELAKRVCATPGDMSILSVSTQMYFEPSLGQVVLAKLFDPKPKVDSQILVLQRRQIPLFGEMDPEILFKVVKAGFSSKRKKLRSSLAGGLGLTKEQATKLLESANIYPQLRAQNLSLQDWLSLANSWAAYNVPK